MPYHAHPFFNEPSPDNARLWRYMDLAQFLSILDKQALFFPSVATLAKADPYEGEPLPTKLRAAQARGAAALHAFRLNCEVFKYLNFYNCWHMNDSESDAMWKVYLKGSQGIAIQSTVARIKSSLQNCLTDEIYMAWLNMLTTTRSKRRQIHTAGATICLSVLRSGTNKKSGSELLEPMFAVNLLTPTPDASPPRIRT